MLQYEKDLVWDDLDLGGLVNSMQPMHGLSDRVSIEEIQRSKILKKHNDMVQKPSYSAIMGRYQALPSKPKSIKSKKLDLLADPIRGRFSRIEKFLGDLEPPRQVESSLSPSKKSVSSKGIKSPQISPKKRPEPAGGFFLTGGDDSFAEPERESSLVDDPPARYGRSGKGLAAALRGRVGEARIIEKGAIKPRVTRLADPLSKNRKPAMTRNAKGAARKEWKDNTHVNYLGKNKGVVKKSGIISEDYKERRAQASRRIAEEKKAKVASSGYGYNKRGVGRTAAAAGSGKEPLPPVKLFACFFFIVFLFLVFAESSCFAWLQFLFLFLK